MRIGSWNVRGSIRDVAALMCSAPLRGDQERDGQWTVWDAAVGEARDQCGGA